MKYMLVTQCREGVNNHLKISLYFIYARYANILLKNKFKILHKKLLLNFQVKNEIY